MEQINPEDNLTRYILQSKLIKLSNNTVKYNAFLPNPKDGKTSVFCITDLHLDSIWEIGDGVAREGKKTLHGRADILASDIINNKLNIEYDNKPPRHANITDWPEDKSKQLLLAQELALKAQLYRR